MSEVICVSRELLIDLLYGVADGPQQRWESVEWVKAIAVENPLAPLLREALIILENRARPRDRDGALLRMRIRMALDEETIHA